MTNFVSLYDEKTVKAVWGLPGFSASEPDEGDYRNFLISWNKLPATTSRKEPVPRWFLCCDVLRIDKEITLPHDTLVFARRIEVAKNAGVVLSRTDGNSPYLLLVAQEVVSAENGEPVPLQVSAINDDDSILEYKFAPEALEVSASGMEWEARAAAPKRMPPSKIDLNYLLEGEPLRLSLDTLFQAALLLSTSDPALSIAQLKWISALASVSDQTRYLAIQAQAMAMTLIEIASAGTDAVLVPQLDLEIYSEKAKAFLGLLEQRQGQWERYKDREFTADLWKGAAESMLATQQNMLALQQKLENMAADTYRQVQHARAIAAKQMTIIEAQVVEKKFDFDAGVLIWERREKEKTAFNIVIGVLKILAQLPAIVVAGPEILVMPALESALAVGQFVHSTVNSLLATKPSLPGDPEAGPDKDNDASAEENDASVDVSLEDQAEAIADTVEAIEESPTQKKAAKEKAAKEKAAKEKAAKAQANLLSALTTVGKEAKEIYDAAMKIAAITASAEKMLLASQNVLAATSTSVGKSFATVGVQGLDVVTGGSQAWDELEIAIEAIFERIPTLNEIEGALAYKSEIRRLVIYGRALCEAKLAVARAASALAEAKARRLAEENTLAIIGKRLKQVENGKFQQTRMSELNFGRVLDAKRTTWIAMEAYRRAFQYFTLAEDKHLPELPPLTASADAYSAAVRNIMTRELQSQALRRNGSGPTKMSPKILLKDAELLNRLRTSGFGSFEISTDSKAFAGFGRVRFDSIRIFLEGLDTEGKIAIEVATSGVYWDKAPGTADSKTGCQTRLFVTQGLRGTFVYDAKDRTDMPYKIEIADRFKNDFTKPTPFTAWTVKVSRHVDGKPLDLSKITGLTLEFKGEATAL